MENTAKIKMCHCISDRFGLVAPQKRQKFPCEEFLAPSLRSLSFAATCNSRRRRIQTRSRKLGFASPPALAVAPKIKFLTNNKFLAVLIFAVFVGVLWGVAGCAKQEKMPVQQAMEITEGASQQVDGFTLSNVEDDGSSSWQLKGDTADISEDVIELKNVNIKSQAKDECMTMKAKKGTIEKSKDLGIFKEDVVFAYDDGTTLTTEAVDWSFKKQIAKAAGDVFVKSGNLETRAKGAYLRKNTNEIYLNKDVMMNASSGTTIKCAGPLVMDYKKNIAVFNKDVSIQNPKGKMTGKRMVVFFEPSKKAVKRIEAFGNVCLMRGNSISTSDKAVYFSEEGKAILTGNPTVFIDSEEARKLQN